MALIDIIKKNQQPEVTTVNDPNQLNIHELQLALQLLKEATIKGAQIEPFYNLIIKLQNQFLEQSKQ